jgi:HD superfamily phosphohydrolase
MQMDTFEILDPIYGPMLFSHAARIIINKPEFQRLRYLKQLGTCYLEFPSANHTRYAHSLGTYHLVDKFMSALYTR